MNDLCDLYNLYSDLCDLSNASNRETYPAGVEWGEADPEAADAPNGVEKRIETIYMMYILYAVIYVICQDTSNHDTYPKGVEWGEADPEAADAPNGDDKMV